MEFRAKPDGIYLNGKRLNLRGCNFFGMEGDNAFHGLWSVSYTSILDAIQKAGYNLIRIPLNLEFMEKPDETPTATINFSANPDLEGKSAGQLLDIILSAMAQRGMLALPDVHRTRKSDGIDPLPINANRSVERLTNAWLTFLERFKAHKNIIGCDLVNEPHGPTTWAQWAGWAETVGNAILAKHPDKLIFVAGIEKREKPSQFGAYWGSVLDSVKERPVKLNVPERLVYSPHYYGPSVFRMGYHSDIAGNVPKVMEQDFGYICREGLGCVFLGEIGGRAVGDDEVFHEAATKYIEGNPGMLANFAMWSVNPNSGDTQGILKDDWKTIDEHKQKFYARMGPNPTKLDFGAPPPPPAPVPPKEEPKPQPPVAAPPPPSGDIKLVVNRREVWYENQTPMAKYEIDVHNTSTQPAKPIVQLSGSQAVNVWSCALLPADAQGTQKFALPMWMKELLPGIKWSFGMIVAGDKPEFKISG
jgi:endoglucanase